jgi:hypothetical protein
MRRDEDQRPVRRIEQVLAADDTDKTLDLFRVPRQSTE